MYLKGKSICFVLPCIAAALFAVSCGTPKQVLYLQDMNDRSQIEIENKFEARISSYDDLRIIVSCFDETLARPFNVNSNQMNYGGGNQHSGYLVDVNGNIQFPVLGEIHVAGMTRLQLQDTIRQMLVDGHYLEDPYVMVRFNNFKIFFLGAEGGKSVTVPEERCTFLEALALGGDLHYLTDRSKIAVLREVDGKMTMRFLDPRSSKVFNDPYFMLKQNDMILTQSFAAKYIREEFAYWTSWLSLFLGTATLVLSAIALSKK